MDFMSATGRNHLGNRGLDFVNSPETTLSARELTEQKSISGCMVRTSLDLKLRLDLYGINLETFYYAGVFWRAILPEFDEIIHRFYAHILEHRKYRKFIPDPAIIDRLKVTQKAHWDRLFTSKLDDDYVYQVVAAAEAHIKIRMPTYHYMAAYTIFLDELHAAAYRHFSEEGDTVIAIVKAINKLVIIDMDLTLSVYMKELVGLNSNQAL